MQLTKAVTRSFKLSIGATMRFFLSIVLFLCLAFTPALAASTTKGVLASVSGQVDVKSKSGKTAYKVPASFTVFEGDTVHVGKNSSATLMLFDGSELTIGADSQILLASMKKPSPLDKILKFKLSFGQLLASVKKLATSKSAFEVEAGGVVCGVRGTRYNYSFDPKTKTVTIHVLDGTVYLNSNGHTYLFSAGQTGTFTNGQPNKPNNQGQSGKGGKGGDKGGNQGGNSSLSDLNQQFKGGITVNPGGSTDNNPITGGQDNGLTNPNVGGAINILIHANVPPAEAVP
jgi:hypothetical protein